MANRLHVLVSLRESSVIYRERLQSSDEVRYSFCESEQEIASAICDADIILGSISFPAKLLSKADQLRWIQVTGAGVDGFLSQGCLPDHVMLTRADVGFGDQIAEYVIGHVLAITQGLRQVQRYQSERRWTSLEVEFIRGRTMAVAGTGSIGRIVAQRARNMGMTTIGLARAQRPIREFDTVYGSSDLKPFLERADVLAICLPLTEQTRGLIGKKEIAWLRPSAILVNVARGAVVDEPALISALKARQLRAAVLDVFSQEPLPTDSPLWSLDNVTVTAHHSGLNIPDDIIDFFLENLRRFKTNQSLNGWVDPKRGY